MFNWIKCVVVIMLMITTSNYGISDDWFENLLFTSADKRLEQSIREASRKQSIYSYNIANATTPGFEPILFDEDRRELYQMVPPGSEYFTKVLVEHMSTKMAQNARRQAAYYALYKKKIDNFRQVATMGKR